MGEDDTVMMHNPDVFIHFTPSARPDEFGNFQVSGAVVFAADYPFNVLLASCLVGLMLCFSVCSFQPFPKFCWCCMWGSTLSGQSSDQISIHSPAD